MLRFGLGFAIALGAFTGTASAQTTETVVAASQSQAGESPAFARQGSCDGDGTAADGPAATRAQDGQGFTYRRRRPRPGRPPRSMPPRRAAPPPSRASTPRSSTEAPIKEGLCGTPGAHPSFTHRQRHLHAAALINCGMLAAAQHLDHQGPAACRPAPARRQDHQDRGDERLLVPHRLRPRRPQAQRARLRRRARHPRLRHRQGRGGRRAEQLGRHQPRHRSCGGGRQSQGRAAGRGADRGGERPARQPARRQIRRNEAARADADGVLARHAGHRAPPRQRAPAASTRSLSSSPAAARSRRRRRASAAPTTKCSPTPTRRARKR